MTKNKKCKDCRFFDRSRTHSLESGVCLKVTDYKKVMIWNDICVIDYQQEDSKC